MTFPRSEANRKLGLPGLEILSVIELEKGLVSIGPTKLIDLVLEKQASGSRYGMLAQYAGEHAPPITKEHADWSFLDEAESELTPPDPASQSGDAS
ncbi:MAG: hypothetical protein JWM53_5133 [bacterium]|nr:hypothetical protein [bacterium]